MEVKAPNIANRTQNEAQEQKTLQIATKMSPSGAENIANSTQNEPQEQKNIANSSQNEHQEQKTLQIAAEIDLRSRKHCK